MTLTCKVGRWCRDEHTPLKAIIYTQVNSGIWYQYLAYGVHPTTSKCLEWSYAMMYFIYLLTIQKWLLTGLFISLFAMVYLLYFESQTIQNMWLSIDMESVQQWCDSSSPAICRPDMASLCIRILTDLLCLVVLDKDIDCDIQLIFDELEAWPRCRVNSLQRCGLYTECCLEILLDVWFWPLYE